MEPSTQPVVTPVPHKTYIPDIRTHFSEIFKFWKENILFFLGLFFVGVLGVIPIAIIVGLFVGVIAIQEESLIIVAGLILGLLGIVAALFAWIYGIVSQIAQVHGALEGKKIGIIGAYKASFDAMLILKFLGGSILWGFLMIAGLLFFILPAVYMAVPLAIWPYVLVKEKLGVIDSMSRAFKLAQGFWWAIALQYGIFILAWYVFQFGLDFVFGWTGHLAGANMFGILIVGMGGFLVAILSILIMAPFQLIIARSMYEKVAAAKAHDPKASQKFGGTEWKILAVVLIGFAILGALNIFALPPDPFADMFDKRGSDYDSYDSSYYDTYDSYDYGTDSYDSYPMYDADGNLIYP